MAALFFTQAHRRILADCGAWLASPTAANDVGVNISQIPMSNTHRRKLGVRVLDRASRVLKPGDDVLMKSFRGPGIDEFIMLARGGR
jgi:hypothetical protein